MSYYFYYTNLALVLRSLTVSENVRVSNFVLFQLFLKSSPLPFPPLSFRETLRRVSSNIDTNLDGLFLRFRYFDTFVDPNFTNFRKRLVVSLLKRIETVENIYNYAI